jgi:hypothetical protein
MHNDQLKLQCASRAKNIANVRGAKKIHAVVAIVQIDGCEHHWFEDRGPACTALVFIDDATSRLMQILFNGSESTLEVTAPFATSKPA